MTENDRQQLGESERQLAELEALRRMLSASKGTFSISVAVCNSPAVRDDLIQRLITEAEDIAVISIPEGTGDVFELACRTAPQPQRSALFILDLEKSLPSSASDYPLLRSLNATRELWQSAFACPVVFWLPDYATALLSTYARDFWAWRSHQFEFESELEQSIPSVQDRVWTRIEAAARLDAEQKQFRVLELQRRISEAGDPPKPELLAHVEFWLNELAFLLYVLGNYAQAEDVCRKALGMHQDSGRDDWVATDYGNLGILFKARGDYAAAEKMYRKALENQEKRGDIAGMAIGYANLGSLMRVRGELDRAEELHRKALELFQKIGYAERVAGEYGGLGNILQARGDLEAAEAMYRKALEIGEQTGDWPGIANIYGNLGVVREKRGDLLAAESLHRRAIEIYSKLGDQLDIAGGFGNLANVMAARGDLDQAEGMYRKALEIYESLAALHAMAQTYNNLANVLARRGDLTGAATMYRRSAEVFEKLGNQADTAISYANLGLVMERQSDHAMARRYWSRSRVLFHNVGMQAQAHQVQERIDRLSQSEAESSPSK